MAEKPPYVDSRFRKDNLKSVPMENEKKYRLRVTPLENVKGYGTPAIPQAEHRQSKGGQ